MSFGSINCWSAIARPTRDSREFVSRLAPLRLEAALDGQLRLFLTVGRCKKCIDT